MPTLARLAEFVLCVIFAHRVQKQNDVARDSFEKYLQYAGDAPDAGIIRGYLEGLQE